MTEGTSRPPESDAAMRGRQSEPSVTARLADYWSAVALDQLPVAAIEAAKTALLDTIAVALAGSGTEVALAARTAIRSGGASGPAVAWGCADRLPPSLAAFVNGVAAHSLELDDFSGAGHLGCSVVPALCALAESFRVTGRDTLVAMVAGYDVGDRVAEGLGGYRALNDRGWHSTGTCGTFAAAAAAARSLSLTADTFCDALGIASGFTGGTWAFLADGAMTKRYHPGKAAETGLMAALLAHSGMTGPRMALEAEWGGLLGTYVGSLARPEAVVLELGRDFKILNDGIKPYACCRSTHGAVDIVLDLRQDGTLRPERIRRVIFHGTEANRRQLENQHVESVLEAQFSLPYTVAVAAVYGRATLDLFRPVRSSEPAIRDLMARVEMLADRPTGGKGEADLEIVLDDGSVLRRHVPTPRGDPRNPLSGTQLEEKAERLIVPVLGARTFEEIVGCVNHLEKLSSLSELTRLLALDREPTGGR